MKKLLLTTALLALGLQGAVADTLLDPLHGMVCSGAGTACTNSGDNGSFTPLGSVSNWGFSVNPGPATGNLTLVFMVPTNEINVATFNLPGLTDNGGSIGTSVFSRVSLFQSGSPDLPVYLGLPNAGSYSPTDNFSNMSAGTSNFDPGFTGQFLVFTATLNGINLSDVSSTTILNDFSFGSNLPAGTEIAGLFFETSGPEAGSYIGTAASGHLTTTTLAVPGPVAGAGLPGLITLGAGVVAWTRRRRPAG